jgi:hypothetical protein
VKSTNKNAQNSHEQFIIIIIIFLQYHRRDVFYHRRRHGNVTSMVKESCHVSPTSVIIWNFDRGLNFEFWALDAVILEKRKINRPHVHNK